MEHRITEQAHSVTCDCGCVAQPNAIAINDMTNAINRMSSLFVLS